MVEHKFYCSARIFQNGTDNINMLAYFEDLDPIELKYKVRKMSPGYVEAAKYEEAYQFGRLNKRTYSYMMENLKLVYGHDNPVVDDDIVLYHLIESKIINQYFGISQLNDLFDEDYFNFEWDMHVGQNFSEHHNDYYRDHFIHQIRNLYMMLVMLDKFDIYEASRSAFESRNAGKLSEYVSQMKRIFQMQTTDSHLKILSKICQSSGATEKQYIEDYFYRYIIHASSMLSALFHDLGYPICHFLEVRHRVSSFNPTLYMFTHNAVESFDMLASKLRGSLLFTIVSQAEIKKRLELAPGKEKYDHGAYSAIAFLLHFYETGRIHSLSAEKQCAIEMAALAIYNHTAKFRCITGKNEQKYYSMVFRANPVSFLLRFCDDLQEWDRRYFEISQASDLLFCQKCGSPFLKRPVHSPDENEYWCNCDSEKNLPIRRPNVFFKRKLYIVSVVDWVEMHSPDKKNKEDKKDKDYILTVCLNFDLYKLLLMSYINNNYAKIRLDEFSKLKKLLDSQVFVFPENTDTRFDRIVLDYFVTANPLLIKLKILERWIVKKQLQMQYDQEKLIGELRKIVEDGRHTVYYTIVGSRYNKLGNYLCDGDYPVLRFYASLLIYCLYTPDMIRNMKFITTRLCNQERAILNMMNKDIESYHNVFQPYIDYYHVTNSQYYQTIQVLIDDCKKHYQEELICREFGKVTASTSISVQSVQRKAAEVFAEKYEEAYKREANLYQHIAVYTEPRNSFNQYMKSHCVPYIGYYIDMFFFYLANEQLKNP